MSTAIYLPQRDSLVITLAELVHLKILVFQSELQNRNVSGEDQALQHYFKDPDLPHEDGEKH